MRATGKCSCVYASYNCNNQWRILLVFQSTYITRDPRHGSDGSQLYPIGGYLVTGVASFTSATSKGLSPQTQTSCRGSPAGASGAMGMQSGRL